MTNKFFTAAAMLISSGTAFAVDNSFFASGEVAAAAASSPVISFGYIMQLLFSLFIVFCLIYVSAKFVLPKFQGATKTEHLELIDKMIIEPQVTAYIIKAGKDSWLLVSSNKSTTVVGKLEEGFDGTK